MKFEIFVFVEYGGQFRLGVYLNKGEFTVTKSEQTYDFLGYGKGIETTGWAPTCTELGKESNASSEFVHHKAFDTVKSILLAEQATIDVKKVKKFDFEFYHISERTKQEHKVVGFTKIYRVE